MDLVNGEVVRDLESFHLDGDFNDTPMFPPELLSKLNFSDASKVKIKGVSNLLKPAESLFVRPLTSADYHRGFISLLSQLSRVGNITEEMFLCRYRAMQACSGNYYVLVIEERQAEAPGAGRLAATGTLVVEQKFLHECAARARLEDIVVSDEYRGRQLGKVMVECLRLLARHLGCYKASLECTHQLVPFYEQFGFKWDGENNYLIQRYKD